jgi:hypothetical protein
MFSMDVFFVYYFQFLAEHAARCIYIVGTDFTYLYLHLYLYLNICIYIYIYFKNRNNNRREIAIVLDGRQQ